MGIQVDIRVTADLPEELTLEQLAAVVESAKANISGDSKVTFRIAQRGTQRDPYHVVSGITFSGMR